MTKTPKGQKFDDVSKLNNKSIGICNTGPEFT